MLDLNCKAIYDRPANIKQPIAIYLANFLKIGRSPDAETSDRGFSLLEALVGVAVVSIVIVAIAPMVALSTSARINARRIDQATQAARSYVDAVRGGSIDTTNFPDSLVVSSPNAQSQYTFESIVAPSTSGVTASTTTCKQITDAVLSAGFNSTTVQGTCVDSNGTGFILNDPQDLFVQPMRSGPKASATGASANLKTQGFWLAVRVYRSDALKSGQTLKAGTESECVRSKLGFGNTNSILCPIVTIRTQVLPTVTNNLDSIRTGIGSN